MGCDLSISKERLDAPVHHFSQRLHVHFVCIATDLVRLTGDVDFYRTLHSRTDNIERYDNVKQAASAPIMVQVLVWLCGPRGGLGCAFPKSAPPGPNIGNR